MIVFGFHAIEMLLAEGKEIFSIHAIFRPDSDRVKSLKSLAHKNKISWREYSVKDKQKFEAEFRKQGGQADEVESSQGVFAQIPEFTYTEFPALLHAAKEKENYPIIVFLDSVTDPQNIGSILRSGAFFNIAGLVITEHRAAPITATAIKISSGGFAHVPVAQVTNLSQAIEMAKEAGFWVAGLSEHASERLETARLDAPIVLIIGNEENGLRPLTMKNCDYTLSLPALGSLKSLNAAVATAVALSLVRERQKQISLS